MDELEPQGFAQEIPAHEIFVAPSIHERDLLDGESYTHYSQIPEILLKDMSTECCIGIDEAGRGPVLGPMVYGLFYLPLSQHHHLLVEKHHFNDSKVLTPIVRSRLMERLCSPHSDLHQNCGWATRVMSARDISAGMLKPAGTYNLNAQAMDATIQLIKDVFAHGINVREIYIDTIGNPQSYQKKLEPIFPTTSITVAKKADSLYPCVSAASVCAKVTRDAALEFCYHNLAMERTSSADGWGSGYPSDTRCTTWLRGNLDPLFGWGQECRFSWGTAKDLLEAKGTATKVDFPLLNDDDQGAQLTSFFSPTTKDGENEQPSELGSWFGQPAAAEDL